jgi:hypothetical protein
MRRTERWFADGEAWIVRRACACLAAWPVHAKEIGEMSAFPPKADMCGALVHVCFGPKADIANMRSFGRYDFPNSEAGQATYQN